NGRDDEIEQCRSEESDQVDKKNVSRFQEQNDFDPHPALRATLSQWERDSFRVIPSSTGRGWRGAPGEGRRDQKEKRNHRDQPGEKSGRRVVITAQEEKRQGKAAEDHEQQYFELFHLAGFRIGSSALIVANIFSETL